MHTGEFEVLLGTEEIQAKVKELGEAISRDYAGKELLVVGVLKGAFIFMADLVREIKGVRVTMDFMDVSSYGLSTLSSGEVRIMKDLECSIEGLNVLLVEDIIDTGLTLAYIKESLMRRGPKEVKICSFLDKPSRRRSEVAADYIGYSIPDEFVVGYGLDYAEKYRNYPMVCILDPSANHK